MDLTDFYAQEGLERVGLILKDGTVVELENIANDPQLGFLVRAEDMLKYEDQTQASFHTHPGLTSNLSAEDYETFKMWPELAHYIVGLDGVSCYRVSPSGVVTKDEA